MGITKLAIKRPVSVIIILIGIIIFGFSSLLSFDLQLTPDLNLPMLIVTVVYPGANAEEVEDLVSKPIEDAGSTLKGLDSIQSVSNENVGTILFSFEYGTSMDDTYSDLKEAIDALANDLPEEAQTPIIMELDMNASASVTLSASGQDQNEVLNYVNETVKPELEKLGSVAKVEVSGGQKDYISVELNEEALSQYGLTMSSVVEAIKTANFSIPIGEVTHGSQDISVNSSQDYDSIRMLNTIPITTRAGNVIHIKDVADIHIAKKTATSISRYNNKDNLSIAISKRQSSTDVAVANDVEKVIKKLNKENDIAQLLIIDTASEMILSSLKSVGSSLILGMVLSMLILFIFFGDFKASLIVGSSMPISVLVTLIIMNFIGFSLNIITMGGLVIGVGMMVDNSIVVIESIFRRKEEVIDFRQAALEGCKFVTNSVIASTLTTIVVFLPLALLKGMAGQLFNELGFTITFALLASLISAITLVPLFFGIYKPTEKKELKINAILDSVGNVYAKVMNKLLKRKKTVLASAVALFIISILLLSLIGSELIPDMAQGKIDIKVTMRPGLNINKVEKIMTKLEDMVKENDDVETYRLTASTSSSTGSIAITLKDKRSMETEDIVEMWQEQVSDTTDYDVEISENKAAAMSEGMTSSGSTVTIDLVGDNLNDLKKACDMVATESLGVNGVIRSSSSLDNQSSKVDIQIDPIKAASIGYTPVQISGLLHMIISGSDTIDITKNDKTYTVTVEYPKNMFEDAKDLKNITLISPTTGQTSTLGDVAKIVYTNSPQSISRADKLYSATVTMYTTIKENEAAEESITNLVDKMIFPEGVKQSESFMTEMMNEEFSAIYGAIATAILLVFMVMAIEFESARFSIMVMVSIPFSFIGSFLLLFLTGTKLSMPSLLGVLLLVGTVVNNGILFVDTTNQLRQENEMNVFDALIYTGKIRLRPILMTTSTTILSMLPMALGIGSGTEMMGGMAKVIIGGLISSTFLTLLLLPTFYLLIDKIGRKKQKH
ncbi:MAG: efflux RND transporter permease subunit [Lachnospiraceae bacterium]